MNILHLKKLAQGAVNYPTNIFNLTISTGPGIRHKAIIIPILKLSKDNDIGKNWRPISPLCPAAKVNFRQMESMSRKLKTGVLQGGVLSPALFNYYLADFPTPPPNINLIKYADDITIYTSGTVVTDLINGLNIYLSQVLNYINDEKLTASTAKSTVTLSRQILTSTTYINKWSWPTKYYRSKRNQKC